MRSSSETRRKRWRQPGLNQDAYRRSRELSEPGTGMLNKARRLLPVASFFAIAFAVDQLTGQRGDHRLGGQPVPGDPSRARRLRRVHVDLGGLQPGEGGRRPIAHRDC